MIPIAVQIGLNVAFVIAGWVGIPLSPQVKALLLGGATIGYWLVQLDRLDAFLAGA